MGSDSIEAAAKALAREHGYVSTGLLSQKLGVSADEAKQQLKQLSSQDVLELDLEGDDIVYRLKGQVRADAPIPAPQPKAADAPPKTATTREAQRVADAPPDAAYDDASPPPPDDAPDSGESVAAELRDATTAMMSRGKTALATAAVGALMDSEGAKEVTADEKKSLAWGVGLGLLLPGIGLFYAAPMVTAGIASAIVLVVLGLLQVIPVLGTLLSYFVFGFFMLVSGALGGAYTFYFNKTGRRTRLTKPGKGVRALPL